MPPGKPIKRYTGAADGRTIGMVLNELIDEINAMTVVLSIVSETVVDGLSPKGLAAFSEKLLEWAKDDPK